jgi:hypothetical protein
VLALFFKSGQDLSKALASLKDAAATLSRRCDPVPKNAYVPVMVAESAPTALAVRTAQGAGITLVAIARDDGFEVFTYPCRIAAKAAAQADPMSPDKLVYMANQIGIFLRAKAAIKLWPESRITCGSIGIRV